MGTRGEMADRAARGSEHRGDESKTCLNCLEPVDVIAGGFPCQDVSVAGKRAGIKEGTRSGLWFEFHRIICELRPRYVFVENVSGLLTDGMGRVLGDLASIGYDAEWEVLSAADVGAPHLRKRVFIVAYPVSDGRISDDRGRTIPDEDGNCPSEIQRQQELQSGTRGSSDVADTISDTERATYGSEIGVSEQGRQEQNIGQRDEMGCYPRNRCGWTTEPSLGRVANGVPNRVDRIKGLGNAVVPQCAEYIGRKIIAKCG